MEITVPVPYNPVIFVTMSIFVIVILFRIARWFLDILP